MRILNFLSKKFGEMTQKYTNLPLSYMERVSQPVYWRTPRGYPQYLKKTIKQKKIIFDANRPWSQEYMQDNPRGTIKPKAFVEPIATWSFFKGDRVEVLVGKDKGKQGIVTQIIEERNWVVVEGLNAKLKLIGKSSSFPGTYVRWEEPLLIMREVKLVDPETLGPTDIEWKYTEEGEKVRVSKTTGRIIPIPGQAEETYDYKVANAYVENEKKDTKSHVISEITFTPALKTFEMDIMDKMGIKEDRIPKKTYWY